MNLLYLIPSLENAGGMERVLSAKVNYLVNNKSYRVVVITTDMQEDVAPFYELDSKVNLIKLDLNYKRCFEDGLISKTLKIYNLNFKYKEYIKKNVNDYSIDICISMGGKELEFLGDLNLPCKILYESHFNKNFRSSFMNAQERNNILWRVFGKFRDYQHTIQALKFDKIVVLTESNLANWRVETKNVEHIPNPTSIHSKYSTPPALKSKRAIAIGKLDPQKGFDMLINAWHQVHLKNSEWTLDIYGDGYLRDELALQIKSLGLTSSVRLCGLTRNVEYELRNSSFYILSSRFEGLPMVLIESITCGLPIVSFDCESGPREIIKNNDCGFLVEPNNIEKLSESIIDCIDNPILLEDKSIEALRKSKAYNLDQIMNKWVDIFNMLMVTSKED